MRTLVLYFSLTGNTRKVAEALAAELGAELHEIACPAYRSWYRAPLIALDMMTRRRPRIELPPNPASPYNLTLIGGPVWAGRPAMPVMSLLSRIPPGHGRIGLFVTCGGTSPSYPPERAMTEMLRAAAIVAGTRIFREAEIKSGAYRADAAAFAAALALPETA